MSRPSLVPAAIADLPWSMLSIVLSLVFIGVLSLYSAAGGSFSPWAFIHSMRFCAFLCLMFSLAMIRPQTFHDLAFPAYAGGIVLLIVTLLLGEVRGGARSWLEFGFLRIQPSELMKPILVLLLARFYSQIPPREIRRWSAIWPVAVFLGPPLGLILLQPDLGTTMLIVLNTIAMMFLPACRSGCSSAAASSSPL